MALGDLLKKFRELRGFTQKSLGEKLGFDDSRIRQYESNRRTPKEDLLSDIADELKVVPEYLDDAKYPYSMDESVRLLFKMEDTLPIRIEEIEVLVDDKYDLKEKKHAIYFSGEEGVYLDHFLKLWKEQREQYEDNYLTEEQYEDWKANWPESSKEEYKYNKMNKRPTFYNDGLSKKNPSLWLNDDLKK